MSLRTRMVLVAWVAVAIAVVAVAVASNTLFTPAALTTRVRGVMLALVTAVTLVSV